MQTYGDIKHILEYQANQIETVLANHRAPCQVTGGMVTHRWVSYQLVPEISTKVSQIITLSEEIALRLGAQDVRVSRKGFAIQIEVPRADAQIVKLLQLCKEMDDIPRQSAILGLDDDGLPLLLRLSSPEVAHVLVAGTTGSGKTVLVRSMALSLAMHNRLGEVQMIFIDPKGTGFGTFGATIESNGLPHLLRPVVRDVHQAIFLLGEMVGEMIRRDHENISEPRLIIFIDELADLMDQGGKAMDRLMTRLTQRGRSAGLHLVACTQKPLAATIGSLTRSNFPVRLVGSVASADDAKIAAGIGGTKAEKLMGRGDFLLVTKGQIKRFQAAHVSEAEIRQVIDRLQAGYRTTRLWSNFEETSTNQLSPTGTEGRFARIAPPGSKRRWGLVLMFGQQLRLLK